MNLIRGLRKLVRRLIKRELADVHTSMIAQVIEYDNDLNKCKLQPCVNLVRSEDPGRDTIPFPVLSDVPVKLPGSGNCLLSVAPQVDSYGVVTVLERSIEEWLTSGGIVDPMNTRKFDISDSVFDPGIYHFVSDGNNGHIQTAIATDRISLRTRNNTTFISVVDDETIEIQNENATVTIDVDGNIDISGADITVSGSDISVVGEDITVNGSDITLATDDTVTINTQVDSAALASKVDLLWTTLDVLFRTAWVPAPTDGGAALKAAYIAAFATPPASVASQSLKVDQ